jgi:type II secretory pathway pseudopilin PulG
MNMKKHNFIRQGGKAFTLAELVIAMTIMVVIMAAILPQFHAIRNSWASSEASANITQNGRVLEEHIIRNLSSAKQLISVSSSAINEGFITFEDAGGSTKRYMFSGGYVVFGTVGSEEQLAGPVSRFRVSSYLIDPTVTLTTDANLIRLVEVETDFTNDSNPMGTDRTFISSIYLRTNAGGCDIVGHWKLDETSGIVASDSSTNGNDGTLYNGPVWTTGQINGGLDLDGSNDYVSLPIGSVIHSLTDSTFSIWVNWFADDGDDWHRIWDFGTGTTYYMYLVTDNGNTGTPQFTITTHGSDNDDDTIAPSAISFNEWHHIAVTIDADNHTYKLYIDGSYVAQNTSARYTPSSLGTTNKNYLGRSNYSDDPYLNGALDDFRIYNRVLTAAEIAELANTLRYRSFDEGKRTSDSTSVVVTKPSGTSSGDLLIAAVATDGSTTFPTQSGWTELDQGSNGTEVTLGAWYKIAGGSEPANYTFNWTGSQQAYGWMMRFSGHDASDPIDYPPSTGSDSDSFPTSPSVTTTVNNCIILRLGAFDDDNIIIDNPTLLSGHTTITADESATATGAVVYQTFSEGKRGSDGTSVAVNKPTGTASGNLLIAAVTTDGDTLSSLSPPSGWTLIQKDTYSPEVTLGVWYKVAGGSELSSYTFTWSGSQQAYGYIMRFTGNDTSNPINASDKQKGSGSASPSCRSVTTTVDNTMIFRIGGFDDDYIHVYPSDSASLPSGHTPITMDCSNTGDYGCSGGAAYKYLPAQGSSSTSSFHLNSSEQYITVTFAIAPAVTGGTVSGGAGYVKQATASSSGTPDFSLGSANEARMITIAINPDTTSNDDCQIRP